MLLLAGSAVMPASSQTPAGVPPPPSTVQRDLSGFGSIWIQPLVYPDKQVDPMNLKPYLEKLLASQGWTVLSDEQAQAAGADRARASATLACAITHTAATAYSGSAMLTCNDLFGRQVFTLGASGSGMLSFTGGMEAALRKIAEQLKTQRPAFDASKTVDLFDTLPKVDTLPISDADIDNRISAGTLRDPIEGVWSDSNAYRLAIVPDVREGDYVAVVLEDLHSNLTSSMRTWLPGMVKARLTQASDGRTYLVHWMDQLRQPVNGVATVEKSVLSVALTLNDQKSTDNFTKIRPTGSQTGPVTTGKALSGVVQTGTGFFCGKDLVATNYHVIDGAKSIEIFLPPQALTLTLETVVSDSANDLAVLRVTKHDDREPEPLTLGDSADVRLGAEIFGVGFPLGDALGTDHTITSGIISSLEGLSSDPRMFQITAPIQPGSSGSPLFTADGRVIGVVTSQNVNFAMRSDYLALLLKRASPSLQAAPASLSQGAQPRPDLIQRVRLSVGQIRANR
jgi:S1-C subfamily serine protease